jgi:hypothetical protein
VIRFPSGVRGPAWRGFTFDPSAHVVSEHLMLQSGEWARGLRAWGDLERGGDSPKGVDSPRARRRFARGGGQPSSEAEIHPRGRPALKRGCPLGGPLRLLGPWTFPAPDRDYVGCAL